MGADYINILGGSVHTVGKNTEANVFANKEIGLEVIADKTNYMVMSRDQNAGRSHSMKIDWEGGGVQIFGNNLNKLKFYSRRNEEQIEVRECFLSFSAESPAFQFATLKYKS